MASAALPRLLTAAHFVTTDEPTWLARTVRFSDALTQLDFSSMSASVGEPAAMPGATTMWIGTVARVIWAALGLDGGSFESRSGLAVAQVSMAVVNALLIGWLFVTVARWCGTLPAIVAGMLVGTEPWFVGLGTVLHTDEMTALFGTIGLVTLARALRIPRSDQVPHRPVLLAVLSGLALTASSLTKITGAGYLTGAAVIVVWAVVRDHREGRSWFAEGTALPLTAWAAAAAVVVIPLAWPALVVDPVFQLERLAAAVRLGSGDIGRFAGLDPGQFFLGRPVEKAGWLFYFVALPLRVTPWFLVLALIGVPMAVLRRATRLHALVLAVPAVALFVVFSASTKVYARYGLLVLVPVAVVAGLGVDQIVRRATLSSRTVGRVLAGIAAVAVAVTVWVAPWGLAYYNPVLGGGAVGERALLVGWGEGREVAAERIEELEGGDCSGTTVNGLAVLWLLGWPCTTPSLDGSEPDYVVLYISSIQRSDDPREPVEDRDLVDVIEIRGIPYAEIWR